MIKEVENFILALYY